MVGTGDRLTAALFGYFVFVISVITLTPFDLTTPDRLALSWTAVPRDLIANVLMFVPVGFLWRGFSRGKRCPGWEVLAVAAAFSILLETAQIFIRDRYVSLVDVLTNTTGAQIGALLRLRLERRSLWRPGIIERLGLHLPLGTLIYLLIPQLWLSGVGVVRDAWRGLLTMLLACAGCLLLAALRRYQWQRERFEVATLRRFVPVFSAYVLLAALWPPMRSIAPWHGAVTFGDRLNDAGIVEVLLLLEQVCGFTLLGYAAAEWRGRRELSLLGDLPRLSILAGAFALALELIQEHLAGPGASLIRPALSTAGAIYGVAVYHLARAHVRALRAAATAGAAEQVDRAA